MTAYIVLSAFCGVVLLMWKKIKLKDDLKIYFVLGFAIGFLGLASLINSGDDKLEINENGDVLLVRKEPGEGAYTKKLVLVLEGVQKEINIRVDDEHLSENEVNEAFVSAIETVDKKFLGVNKSFDEVCGSVDPVKKVEVEVWPEDGSQKRLKADVAISYSYVPSGVIASDGMLRDDKIADDGTLVQVSAVLSCDGRQVEHVFSVMARKSDRPVDIEERLSEEIESRNAKEGEYLDLPSELDGVKLLWLLPEKTGKYNILLLGLIAFAGLFAAKKEDRKRKVKEKKRELERGYPMMVSALSLLIGSGMTVQAAWERIVTAYIRRVEDGGRREAVYDEMLLALRQMKDGKSEKESYAQFAERTDLGIYRKLISMILQNLRKGGKDLDHMLEREVENAYILLRNQAKSKGAEASTKMLLPMMLSLLVVIVVIIVPAIYTMNI